MLTIRRRACVCVCVDGKQDAHLYQIIITETETKVIDCISNRARNVHT